MGARPKQRVVWIYTVVSWPGDIVTETATPSRERTQGPPKGREDRTVPGERTLTWLQIRAAPPPGCSGNELRHRGRGTTCYSLMVVREQFLGDSQ